MLSAVENREDPVPILDRVADALETKKSYLFWGLSILFFIVSGLLSFRKVFWNDEMYTLYFSRLNVWPDLWWALRTGGDQLPPGSIILTKASLLLFGENHISVRLPETLGFFLMCFCLYRIVSKRLSPLYGCLAMIFPWLTDAFDYSYEARPYALVLGFSALAFLCWQTLAEGRNRKISLIGLGVSLFGVWMSHYYGILTYFPLVVGEMVRSRPPGRVDIPVWITFFLSLLPLLLFLPLLQGSLSYASTFYSKAGWSDIFNFYQTLLDSTAVPLIFAASFAIFLFGFRNDSETAVHSFKRHELAAAACFVLIPVVAVLGAKLFTGVFVDRYALPAIIGVSILIVVSVSLLQNQKRFALVMLACFLIVFVIRSVSSFSIWTDDYHALTQTNKFLQVHAGKDLPVVCSYSHIFLRIQHYAPKTLAKRVFYAADTEASVRYINHDTIDRGLLDLKPWWQLQNVKPYDLFIRSHPRFYLLHFSSDEDWKWDWILSRLLADKMKVEMRARDGNQFLFLIERGD